MIKLNKDLKALAVTVEVSFGDSYREGRSVAFTLAAALERSAQQMFRHTPGDIGRADWVVDVAPDSSVRVQTRDRATYDLAVRAAEAAVLGYAVPRSLRTEGV